MYFRLLTRSDDAWSHFVTRLRCAQRLRSDVVTGSAHIEARFALTSPYLMCLPTKSYIGPFVPRFCLVDFLFFKAILNFIRTGSDVHPHRNFRLVGD